MIKVYISGNRADVTEREPLTSGTVGKVINFAFTEDWRPLIKYAVFEGSGRRIALTNIDESCIIPHEVLAKHGGALRVGVYGRTADGSAATPTVYAQLGIIQRGADPNADPSTKPTLPVWAQIQAQIGDLSNLTTEDKTSLVAAINEAAKSGGGSGGKDGTGIESITYKGEDESGGNVYTVLLTDGTSYDITTPKGDKGDKGADGVTPHIGDNGNWYLGTTDTGKPSRGEKGEDASADLSLGLTGATVGQIAKIAAVDASGVPIVWSPVDMPEGGGGETMNFSWKHIRDVELTPDILEAIVSTTDAGAAFSCDEIMLEFTPNLEGYFYVRASQNALMSKNVSIWVTNSKYSQIHVGLLNKKLAITSVFRTDGSLGFSNNYGGNNDIDKISMIVFGASSSVGANFTVKVWGR